VQGYIDGGCYYTKKKLLQRNSETKGNEDERRIGRGGDIFTPL
jgi:hypothetical protein